MSLDNSKPVRVYLASSTFEPPSGATTLLAGWEADGSGIAGVRWTREFYGPDRKYHVFLPWTNVTSLEQLEKDECSEPTDP